MFLLAPSRTPTLSSSHCLFPLRPQFSLESLKNSTPALWLPGSAGLIMAHFLFCYQAPLSQGEEDPNCPTLGAFHLFPSGTSHEECCLLPVPWAGKLGVGDSVLLCKGQALCPPVTRGRLWNRQDSGCQDSEYPLWKHIYLHFKRKHMGKAATMLSTFLRDFLGTQSDFRKAEQWNANTGVT